MFYEGGLVGPIGEKGNRISDIIGENGFIVLLLS